MITATQKLVTATALYMSVSFYTPTVTADQSQCSDLLVGSNEFSADYRSQCFFLGLGSHYNQTTYDESEKTGGFPVIVLLWDVFYWDTDEIGMYFAGNADHRGYWSAALMTRYVEGAYRADDSRVFKENGLQDREDTFEAGLTASIGSANLGEIQMVVATDIGGVHEGNTAELRYLYPLRYKGWVFSPMVEYSYYDEKYANYTFGVPGSPLIPAFTVDSAERFSFGYSVMKTMSRNWSMFHSATLTTLDDRLEESPIVENTQQLAISAGIIYRF